MLTINTNLSSIITQNSLKTSTQRLNQAIERMTTGFKINHAKDNAANYAISSKMNMQISSYDVAADNVAMGMDLVTTASDIISNMQNHASRLQALSIQARNGTYGIQSMSAINSEATAIMAEINRLYSTAEYNNISLFNKKVDEPIPEHKALIESVSAKAEYNSFIANPVTYTDEQVALMTPLTDDITSLSTSTKYSISNVEELINLAELVNSGVSTTNVEFVLGDDIDLSSILNWIPIGDYFTNTSYSFKGTFDGNGHTISNLKINSPDKKYQGLFGALAGGSIKNVGLKNVNITGLSYVGGLVGYASRSGSYPPASSSITNSYVTGNLSGTGDYFGGLAGSCSYTSLANCYTLSSVSFSGDFGGCFIGCLQYSSSATNCYSTGDLIAEKRYLGGFIGALAYDSQMTNCYSTGDVFGGQNYVNDFVGSVLTGATMTNSFSIEFTSNNIPHILQIGINGDEASQLIFDTNFSYDLSAVEADISSDNALTTITDFINLLSEKSTQLGAVQNRLESALDSIEVNINNLTSSRSTLRDADLADESSEYIRQQILQQASATLLATANQSPSIALQLI